MIVTCQESPSLDVMHDCAADPSLIVVGTPKTTTIQIYATIFDTGDAICRLLHPLFALQIRAPCFSYRTDASFNPALHNANCNTLDTLVMRRKHKSGYRIQSSYFYQWAIQSCLVHNILTGAQFISCGAAVQPVNQPLESLVQHCDLQVARPTWITS